jgi:D-alanyl-D-alanine carboxypeptidase
LSDCRFICSGAQQHLPHPSPKAYSYYHGASHPVEKANLSAAWGEGNLVTTPQQLAHWYECLLQGGTGVGQPWLRQMKQMRVTGAVPSRYGLGLTYDEGLGYGHDGLHSGFLSVCRHCPDQGLTSLAVVTGVNYEQVEGQLAWLKCALLGLPVAF